MTTLHVSEKARRVCFTLALFLCLVLPAVAGDFQIVPGQRIGAVTLGMPLATVSAPLYSPRFVRRLPRGIVEESWATPLPRTEQKRYSEDGKYWKDAFVNVYFQQGRVVQVEVNSPLFHVGGLSTNSAADAFEKRFPHYLSSGSGNGPPLEYGDQARDLAGVAGKHFVTIDDAVGQGIAWRFGSWGDAVPDPDPACLEVIIVHRRGRPVIGEPDGGNRFVQTNDAVR